MDSFWSQLNYIQFEDLAQDYAKSLEPSWDWKATKRTRDNSRDGEAKIVDYETNFGWRITKEAWYEAKYSKYSTKSIPLSKIAATILIGLNNKNLEIILVITNAKFSTKTIFEIQKVLGGKMIFVLGEELKSWLFLKEQKSILQKYNLIKNEDNSNISSIYLLKDSFITKPNVIYNTVSTSISNLNVGEEYVLRCVINIPLFIKESNFTFKITNLSKYISIPSELEFNIANTGTNSFSIPFTPIKEGELSSTLFSLEEKKMNLSFDVKKNIRVKLSDDIQVLVQNQIECEFNMLKGYKEFINSEGMFLFPIEGNSGSGKSWTIEKFINSKRKELDSFYLKFNNDILNNSKLLIELLVFLTYGNSFLSSNFEEEDILEIESLSKYNKYYTEYLRYLTNREDLLYFIDSTLNNDNNLIPNSNTKEHRLLVLDDIQFLDDKNSLFLLRILKSLSKSNHNIFVIIAQRELNLVFEKLNNFIINLSYSNVQCIDIKTEDVKNELEKYGINKLPNNTLVKLTKNIFFIKRFISIIKRIKEIDILKVLSNNEIKVLLSSNNDFYKKTYELLNKEERQITDIIYFFEVGVSLQYLINHFEEESLDSLITKKIIKYDYTRQLYIPFHDIYLEKITKLINRDTNSLYNYALHQKAQKNILNFLSIIPYFPTKFIQNEAFFIKQLSKYHENQNFFNVHFILRRYLYIHPNADNLSSTYNTGLVFFYFGYASFNVSNNNGRNYYLKAYSLLSNSKNNKENSLAMLALSEVANCDYWNIDVESVQNKYQEIYGNFKGKLIKNEDDFKALRTIFIRFYATRFLLDLHDEASSVFKDFEFTLKKEKRKEKNPLILTKSIYRFETAPRKSYNILQKSVGNLDTLPVKTKLILKSYLYKMGVFLGDIDLKLLKETIIEGEKNNLTYNTKIVKLQLALCYAIKKRFTKLREVLDEVVDIRDFPLLAKGIYYNLRALISLSENNYKKAMNNLEKQGECFERFGNSFNKKINSNIKYISMRPKSLDVGFVFDETEQSFWIECRF